MQIAGVAVVDGLGGSGRRDMGTSVVDQVYGYIRDQLVSGRISPGARVNLVAVCTALHVSNTPVRRALVRLAAEGYVIRQRNQGFFASPLLDTRTINELYDFRLQVEPTAAGRTARRESPRHLEELAALADGDHDFHLTLAQCASNRLEATHLGTTFESLRHLASCGAADRELARDEHSVIIAAIADADADRAAAAMHVHLSNSRDRLRGLFA